MTGGDLLLGIRRAFGDLGGWWPADGPFEVAVGALLVQAVAWRNAGLAIAALKGRGLLHPQVLAQASPEAVSDAIRPALFHLQKTRYLLAFARFVQDRLQGDIAALRALPAAEQEGLLLGLPGVGQETAAAIMVYALGEAVPVVDAYAFFARAAPHRSRRRRRSHGRGPSGHGGAHRERCGHGAPPACRHRRTRPELLQAKAAMPVLPVRRPVPENPWASCAGKG